MSTKFRTAYSPAIRVRQNAGTRFRYEYEYKIDKSGHKKLQCTAKIDQYAEIQTYKNECLIENIIAKAKMGDMSGLVDAKTLIQGMDISEIPDNMIEIKRQIQDMENAWTKLPAETRAKFGNNPENWVNEAGTKQWMEKLGYVKKEEGEEESTNKKKKEATASSSSSKKAASEGAESSSTS